MVMVMVMVSARIVVLRRNEISAWPSKTRISREETATSAKEGTASAA